MHETGLAVEIFRASLDAVASRGPGRLERVTVAIGDLSSVEPDLLTFAWEGVVTGSLHEACALEVDRRKAHQHCLPCGEEKARSEGSWLRICPDCGSPLRVDGGRELDLLSVSYLPDGDDENGAADVR